MAESAHVRYVPLEDFLPHPSLSTTSSPQATLGPAGEDEARNLSVPSPPSASVSGAVIVMVREASEGVAVRKIVTGLAVVALWT